MNVVFIKKKKKLKKILVTFCGYTDSSNKWLIYTYKFVYMMIIFTYWKKNFISTQLVKKIYYEKFNTFTCRIVLPD